MASSEIGHSGAFPVGLVRSGPVQVLMRAVRWCVSLSLVNDCYVLISNGKLQTKFETCMANMNSCSIHLSNIICLVALATEPAENQNEYTCGNKNPVVIVIKNINCLQEVQAENRCLWTNASL